ncbi:hypothetical protein L1276_000173 [Flavobacterium sp. HSC-32F16]|uniref:DUF4302 domain-containing protein n=1 Tax=Flavobacterium sp. HSC-32F16 TaxID=2910964 RepID=UPI0020A5892A|nr:DUF4302 domain-containing protein [Flavobacterium sp. HSC-32F16]MCP2025033.1 hypothetical protein [Flavobacterium sp. HSC-32F16]
MKVKHIYKYLLIVLIAVIMGACTSTEADAKFDENPLERVNARKKELNDLLLSSAEGWKLVYYTDNSQLGGWTHLFKFLPDGKVDMASDFDADTGVYRSQYELQLGSTVSLVFTTANRIHLLSQSDNYPTAALLGKGYLGDFQFFYYGQENGEIIFKTNRDFKEIRFVKATAQDWTDLEKNTISSDNISSKLYRLLDINDGAATQHYDFDVNYDARFAVANSLETGVSKGINIAYQLTPSGITVKPEIEVKGQKLSNFIYDAATENFVAVGTNGVSATIKYTFTPPVLTDDYKIALAGQPASVFGYYSDDTTADAPTNTKQFKDALAKANELLGNGDEITSVQIYFNHATLGNLIYYTFAKRAAFIHRIDVVEDAAGKKIILKHKSGVVPAFLVDFEKYLLDPTGVYVKKEAFKLSYPNLIYTFTSAGSSFRITAYKL